MILVESRSERSGIGRRAAEFILVVVGIVEVIVVKILLLAPDSPGSVGQTGKQESTSDSANHTSDCSFGRAAESGAAAFVSVARQ
jgi:predicted metalloprotease